MPSTLHPENPAWNGGARDALTHALAELDSAERLHQPHAMAHALGQVGRAYRALGEWAIALRCLRQAHGWAGVCGAADGALDLQCELAETALDAGDDGAADDAQHARALYDQARDHAFEASRMAAHCADPQWEVTVLLRVSDVLDRCGDHDDAIALQCRALQLIARHAAADAAAEPDLAA